MFTRKSTVTLLVVMLSLSTFPVSAQQLVSSTLGTPAYVAEGQVVATPGNTTVIGTVWDANSVPIPYAKVRLRSFVTGQVVANATADQSGEFRFDNVEPGSYVVELVDDDGNVVALGQTFTIDPGQTVITFIMTDARDGGFLGGIWGPVAAAAIAAAAGLGVTAVQECSCAPLSPEGDDPI